MSLNCGTTQQHMSPNMHDLKNLGNADLGSGPLLSLLSGPPANVSCDLQHFFDPKPVPVSNQVSLTHRTANGFSTGNRVPEISSAFQPHNLGCQNLISGEVLFSLMSSKSTMNSSNGSAILQTATLDFQKSQPVASCQNPHESYSFPINNTNNAGPIPDCIWKPQKHADITALQKVPNISGHHHGHNPSSSFPRVLCSGTSGNLLLSDTKLLGVVCACHGLYMSIAKFSEIRLLEGHRRWDWPERISASSGLTDHPKSNMSNNSVSWNNSVSSEQRQHSVLNSKENQSCRNIAHEYAYREKDRSSHECSLSLFKYFIDNSHGNPFVMNSEKASHSTTSKLDPVPGDLKTPFVGFGVGRNPTKVFLSEELLQKSNEVQGSKWTLLDADNIASNPIARKGPTHLKDSSHVGGAYGAITDYWKDSPNGNLKTTCLNPLLPLCLKNNFPWSGVAGNIQEFRTDVSNGQNHMNMGKKLESSVNDLLDAAKSNVEFSNTFKKDLSTSNIVLGKKKPHLYQKSNRIEDRSYDRDILNNFWNISSLSDMRHINHDRVKPIQNSVSSKETTAIDFTSKSSVFVQSATPTLSKKGFCRINQGQKMVELSDRDNDPASVRYTQGYCEVRKNPCLQSPMTTIPSISKDHVQLLDFSRMPNIPKVGEKSTMPGTLCWMGCSDERFSTVTGRSPSTTGASDLPSLEQFFVRPGGKECNLTLSKKEQCVPEKRNSVVQANCLIGKYDSNGDYYCSLVKGDKNEAALSSFHSKLNDNCVFPKERTKSCKSPNNLVAPNVKSVQSHSFQWKDVPKKIMESCSSTRKEHQTGTFNASSQNVVPVKEHEISILSSGCSAPDVTTQSSIEVNKKDYSTAQGSGTDRSWSSVDALDNVMALTVLPREPSFSLIEEIGRQNSFKSVHSLHNIEESDCVKTVKWMNLDAPFSVSGQSSINSESLGVDDTLETFETFRKKKRLRLDDACAPRKGIREMTSLGGHSNSQDKPDFPKCMARPVVFGKYGIISNGSLSKPTKIIPLSKIIKTAASHTEKQKPISVKEMNLSNKVLWSRVKKVETHNSLEPHDMNGEIEIASCSTTNGSDDPSYTWPQCNNHCIKDSKLRDQLKKNYKEGRKRSLHELLIKGIQPSCARTEGYKGRKREGFLHNNHPHDTNGNDGCFVPQEQLNAWLHIHRQQPQRKGCPKLPNSIVECDCRKAYARYKHSKVWKHLVVYKSGIHALGLYTSRFISRGTMVVEYVGEIVGLRVADRRESEYHSGKKLQHKSACYFFRIDTEYIIDATRKGGIARFVNHSCQPNCVAKVVSVRYEKKVVFFAERDIYPGEEITYDYHFNHEGEKIPCYCKSKNCRHFLN
ncbi:histone-lysine n-methyltransferase h3 lysine-4 specific [Phtheirospermum japonicum]|uniref:Histone-lysine n-methyltransferase h3 lysine-4 specific n=1 Tax=Phtheirospermum japonicum TaxID=374723 RepID=A0A830D225_9LAMI|nr:histone-lysine n-methyltransferase h3 lysine-4 specific [Phtheirospermum japonicum]